MKCFVLPCFVRSMRPKLDTMGRTPPTSRVHASSVSTTCTRRPTSFTAKSLRSTSRQDHRHFGSGKSVGARSITAFPSGQERTRLPWKPRDACGAPIVAHVAASMSCLAHASSEPPWTSHSGGTAGLSRSSAPHTASGFLLPITSTHSFTTRRKASTKRSTMGFQHGWPIRPEQRGPQRRRAARSPPMAVASAAAFGRG